MTGKLFLLSTWFFFIRIKMTIQLCLYILMKFIVGSFAVVTRLTWLMPEYVYTPNAILHFTYSTTITKKTARLSATIHWYNRNQSIECTNANIRKYIIIKKEIVEITKWHIVRERILHTLIFITRNSCTLFVTTMISEWRFVLYWFYTK